MKEYDAIIVGSGQGGAPLAHKLADLKWREHSFIHPTMVEGFFSLMDNVKAVEA